MKPPAAAFVAVAAAEGSLEDWSVFVVAVVGGGGVGFDAAPAMTFGPLGFVVDCDSYVLKCLNCEL